jgi:hypothetical protein
MKNTREFYEEQALARLADHDAIISAYPPMNEEPPAASRAIALAQVYATLAAAANDEHTHYYPHKLVDQLPWDERPRAARDALRGVRKGKTTITGEKLQHDASGEVAIEPHCSVCNPVTMPAPATPERNQSEVVGEDQCAALSERGVQCLFSIHRGRHSWEAVGQRSRCNAVLIGPDVADIPCERNAGHAGVHAGANGSRRVTWKD